jgi:hypothetical protein
MDKQELNEARTNPEFLSYLEETRGKAIEEKNISSMYETLDSMLVLGLDEDKINALYTEILKVAFDELEKIVNSDKKVDLEEDHLLYVRAFYEHAIEKWSLENFDGAKELMFVLANIINDELLEKALNVTIIALKNKISVDEFYEEHVDIDENSVHDKYGYFMVDFKFDMDQFLEQNQSILEEEYTKLNHLLDS